MNYRVYCVEQEHFMHTSHFTARLHNMFVKKLFITGDIIIILSNKQYQKTNTA